MWFVRIWTTCKSAWMFKKSVNVEFVLLMYIVKEHFIQARNSQQKQKLRCTVYHWGNIAGRFSSLVHASCNDLINIQGCTLNSQVNIISLISQAVRHLNSEVNKVLESLLSRCDSLSLVHNRLITPSWFDSSQLFREAHRCSVVSRS